MTEPAAYLAKDRTSGRVYAAINKWESHIFENIPLYTAEQLHPRVKMTQAEFDEFQKLLSIGIDTIYEAFDVIDSDRGEMDEFEQLYNRIFTGSVSVQAKSQIEFSKLWDSLSTSSPEETIEIVPDMKWFVRAKKPMSNGKYLYLENTISNHLAPDYHQIKLTYAQQFNTKSEAEKWTNPLTEAVQFAQKSINWTIFIQLLRQHLRYDCDYKN